MEWLSISILKALIHAPIYKTIFQQGSPYQYQIHQYHYPRPNNPQVLSHKSQFQFEAPHYLLSLIISPFALQTPFIILILALIILIFQLSLFPLPLGWFLILSLFLHLQTLSYRYLYWLYLIPQVTPFILPFDPPF